MGNYNSQYESYYQSIVNRKDSNRSSNYHKKDSRKKINNSSITKNSNYITRKIIQDLCGVFVMILIVIICKVVSVPQTDKFYTYSKEVISTNFDYKVVVDKLKDSHEKGNIQDEIIELIDNLKSKIMGGETIKNKIREKFILPVNGNMLEKSEGIDIEVTDDSPIKASYSGRIKECGMDSKLGNYIIIDHGEGIESIYSNLDKILVKEKDVIEKGEEIGVSNLKNTKGYINFKVLFMGQDNGLEKIIRNK